MYVQGNVISGKCTFREMYVRNNVVSAKCFSGKCNFWKVFFGEVYRILLTSCKFAWQQFGKRSENVKGKLCLKVIIAIFPWLTIVLSFRDVAKTAFWVNWNWGTWPPVATALHHFPAYATDLSADLDVWKDENEIWRPLRLRMAYSSGFQPVGHRSILWWARAIWVIVNSVKKLS